METYKANKKGTRRVVVLFDEDDVRAIDQLGISAGLTSRSETIRQLVRAGKVKAATGEGLDTTAPATAQKKAALAGAANVNQGNGAAQDDYRRE